MTETPTAAEPTPQPPTPPAPPVPAEPGLAVDTAKQNNNQHVQIEIEPDGTLVVTIAKDYTKALHRGAKAKGYQDAVSGLQFFLDWLAR